MKLTKTTTHDITFSVQYFGGNEGGMDHSFFGKKCNELAEAIELLEAAEREQPGDSNGEWYIVADVKKSIKVEK